jgi:sulfite reductase alpha subunit-like flavoprotein
MYLRLFSIFSCIHTRIMFLFFLFSLVSGTVGQDAKQHQDSNGATGSLSSDALTRPMWYRDFRLPQRCTLHELFTVHLATLATPSRSFFDLMAHFASDEMQREKLEEFASPMGQPELHKYCTREYRTFAEVLQEFASVTIPLAHLIEAIPRLQPRLFSISSSPLAHPGRAHITMAVVHFKTPYKREKHGICSSWLASLSPGSLVPVWIRKGSFRLPADTSKPVIMVGPGTGIAPFRAMCHHLAAQRNVAPDTQSFGAVDVYFGNRRRSGDYLYESEWKQFEDQGVIRAIHTAFSRDQDSKVYVQHRLGENANQVWQVLHEQGGYFMLAGNSDKMPQDVLKTIESIAQAKVGCDQEKATAYVKMLQKKHHYVVETWS